MKKAIHGMAPLMMPFVDYIEGPDDPQTTGDVAP
jgi:hypothetical protein